MKKVSNQNSLVSIIVPVYNSEKFLSRCMNSLLKQTYSNLEIILIDDGSSDSSGSMCDYYVKYDGRVKSIHKNNGGVSSARNVGLENVTGEYIAFIDSDDYIEKNYIEELIESINKYNCDCCVCDYYINRNGSIINISNNKNNTIDSNEFIKQLLLVQSSMGFCTHKLWKKGTIENIKFNENIKVGEDALFCMQSSVNINKVYLLNKSLYYYCFNEESLVRKYDENYWEKYYRSMELMSNYVKTNYKNDSIILSYLNNYIAYHILLIMINYCFNYKNKLNFIDQINELKRICNLRLFSSSIKKTSYKGFSLTRKIALFTLKNKLYFVSMIIGKIRQIQLKK